jgi:hypothetical protein
MQGAIMPMREVGISGRMRRWLLIAAPVVGLLVLGLWLFMGRAQRITKQNFDRIEEGMSQEEVDALLGKYRGGMRSEGMFSVWYSDHDPNDLTPSNSISVTFDGHGKVVYKAFHSWTVAEWWRRVRDRLRPAVPMPPSSRRGAVSHK